MESNAFGNSHLQSQALVVLSEAASGLHEALRGQRPFPSRLPDAKDLHNMSLVGSYGTHLLHSFHPHLLQTLNHGMLANGGPASYFASDRGGLGKPSVLSNFQLPSAFSPPKYIGISLDQNLFSGNESFRTDSASPTCTSHESMEGSNDYDGEKGESPRSNNSDPRDLRHVHNKASTSVAPTTSAAAAAAAAAVASVASNSSSPATVTHLSHHAPHPHPHHHHHHHQHHPNGSLLAASMSGLVGSCPGLRGMPSSLVGGLSAGGGPAGMAGGLSGHVPDICPVCGMKLTAEEWNSHFLSELDRLYKLSSGMERTNLQATYMFAPPCPSQENAIRTSHNRWETFQRIRNNRQNRLRIKVRKRKYGNELYFMENLLCSSCPICKRKYAMETGKLPPEEDPNRQDEIETVDVESCNDDVPDSGSEMQAHTPMLTSLSGSGGSSNGSNASIGGNMHNSNNQPGKLDGILYRTACVINKEVAGGGAGEDDVSTVVNATSTSSNSSSCSNGAGGMLAAGGGTSWGDTHTTTSTTTTTQGHISVKNVSELSSTTHHFYNADSCGDERAGGGGVNCNGKNMLLQTTCNNDSDEDVIVDDDDSIKMTNLCKKRKYEDVMVVSSRTSENHSPYEERPRSEPQVTSTEPNMEMISNNNNNSKYAMFEELRAKQQLQHQTEADTAHGGALMPGLTHLDSKVGISSDSKPDDENKCFICKTGIKDLSPDSFFRGRNLYFHQSCANVMSTYRLSKDLQHQQNLMQQQQQQEADKSPQHPTSANN